MPVDFAQDTITALRAVIVATWPETKPVSLPNEHGIYEVEHVLQIPWVKLRPPYAVICMDDMVRDEQYSGVVDVYRVPIKVYYVGEFKGPQGGLRAKLLALRRALNATPSEDLQVVSIDQLSTSADLPPNAIFLGTKNETHRAGMLTVTVLTGAGVGE